jgi:UDP-N-acetylglucosamine--N-acetylmuramyl-(pentapeptide) pyrophosphoryl-undecaprenol N-acetylglucosamine transferase
MLRVRRGVAPLTRRWIDSARRSRQPGPSPEEAERLKLSPRGDGPPSLSGRVERVARAAACDLPRAAVDGWRETPSASDDGRVRRIALATGGTAGHVTPALAVAAAYRAARPDTQIVFLGSAAGFEQRLVAAHGHRFETIPAAPLYGVTMWGRGRALTSLAAGVRHARRVLARERVELVIGFGSYASAGSVLGACSLGLAAAVLEANAEPGLTNRLLMRVVDRVFLASDGVARRVGDRRGRRTGTPIRADVAALAGAPRRPPDPGRARVLVCGGSLGSPFLNRHAPELCAVLHRAGLVVEVRHQSGRESSERVRAAYAARGVTASVAPYVDDMADAYAWADVVVACAGAATLAELAAAGLPALLVPLAAASDDHQAANAAAFAAATGAPWVRETGWDAANVGSRLAALLGDAPAWRALSDRTRAVARADAAGAVVMECEALLDAGPRRDASKRQP